MKNIPKIPDGMFPDAHSSDYPLFKHMSETYQLTLLESELHEIKLAAGPNWVSVKSGLPRNGEWVLHTYADARAPEYGLYLSGKFWRGAGPESFPTTHWLRVPPEPQNNH